MAKSLHAIMEVNDRIGFIRKVYSTLFAQLAITTIFVYFCMANGPKVETAGHGIRLVYANDFFKTIGSFPVMIGAVIGVIASILGIACARPAIAV